MLRTSSVAAPAAPAAAAAPVAIHPAISLAYIGYGSSPGAGGGGRSASSNYAWVNVDPDTGRKVGAPVPPAPGLSRQPSVTAAAAAAPPAGGQSPDFVAQSPPLEKVEKQELSAAASSSAKSSAPAKPTRDDLKAIMAHAMLVMNNEIRPTGTSKDADNAEEHTNVARVKHPNKFYEDCEVVPSEVIDKVYNPEDPDTVSSLRDFASDYVKASGAAFKPLGTLLLGLAACSVMWSGMKAKFKPWLEQTAVRTAVYVRDILDVVPAQKGGRFDCVPIVDQNGKKIFLSCGSLDALHCAISTGKMTEVYERNPRISKYPFKYAVSALPTKETARGKLYWCSYENLPPAYRLSGFSAVIWGLGKRRTLVVHDEEDRFPNAPENKPSWIHLFKEAGFTPEQAEALSGNPSKYVPVGAPSADPASSVYAETKKQVAAKISKIKDLPDGFDLANAVDTIFCWKTVIETAGLPVPRGRSTIPQETLGDGKTGSDVLNQKAGEAGMSTKDFIRQLCLRCIAEEYRLEACFAAKVVKFMFTHYDRDSGLPVFNCVMVFQSKYTVAEQSRLDAVCKTVAASNFGLIPSTAVGNKRSAPDGADDVNEEGAGAKRARVAEPKTIYVFDDNEKNLARAEEHYAKNHPGHKVVLVHVPTAGPKMDEDGNVVRDADGRKQYYTWAEAMAAIDAGKDIDVTGLASQWDKFAKIVMNLKEGDKVYMDLDCCFCEDSTNQRKEFSHIEALRSLKRVGIDKHGSPFFKDLRERKIMIIKEVLDSGASFTFYTQNNKASTIRRLRDVWELPEDDIKRCGLICGTQIMMNGEVEITPKHELLGGEVKTIGQLGFWDDIAL